MIWRRCQGVAGAIVNSQTAGIFFAMVVLTNSVYLGVHLSWSSQNPEQTSNSVFLTVHVVYSAPRQPYQRCLAACKSLLCEQTKLPPRGWLMSTCSGSIHVGGSAPFCRCRACSLHLCSLTDLKRPRFYSLTLALISGNSIGPLGCSGSCSRTSRICEGVRRSQVPFVVAWPRQRYLDQTEEFVVCS